MCLNKEFSDLLKVFVTFKTDIFALTGQVGGDGDKVRQSFNLSSHVYSFTSSHCYVCHFLSAQLSVTSKKLLRKDCPPFYDSL